ncbi:NUDIX hydrolase [Streptomyces sp. WZ.A104]|uniref:NUDIX domain-containing protein n=1 Tax=Streptomyces sp. WZ.A104 TaxID=2023771 RepID=UPI000BBBBDC1|nr:NUDIX domain-containing protein [Streptomyces sp. WZ.A104]PCG87180.1 NUDIX hydrolase [Streptomyces sp. WZ.A104]
MGPSVTATVRNAAKAVVLNDGRVLLQRAHWEGQDCYFLPGGGQEPGEALDTTVRREVLEETGLDVTPERLLWLREYIGANHGGAPQDHRVEAIFLCRAEGDPDKLGGHAEDDAQTGLEWVELAKVPALNLLPHGLRPLIAGLAHTESPTRYLGDIA